jgi:hypothetical protein
MTGVLLLFALVAAASLVAVLHYLDFKVSADADPEGTPRPSGLLADEGVPTVQACTAVTVGDTRIRLWVVPD